MKPIQTSQVIPKLVQQALNHVRYFHPDIDMVVYTADTRWHFMSEGGLHPTFDPDIDVSILEKAQNFVGNNFGLPAVFQDRTNP